MSRSGWLRFFSAAVALGLLALGGCSDGRRTLRLYTWYEYFAPGVITAFEQRHDCHVEIISYRNNEEMLDRLRTEGAGFCDLIIPSSFCVLQMLREGLIVPIDHARCPSVRRNFDRAYAYTVPEDPELCFAVPYAVCQAGFFCATNCIPRGLDINTWTVLGDPAVKGRISLLDEMRHVLGAALISLGYSVNSENEREIEAATDRVLAWAQNARIWTCDDYKFEVMAGNIWIGQGYGAVVQTIIAGGEDHPASEKLTFVYPREGFIRTSDELAVSSGCRDADLAHAFLEFLYSDPDAGRMSIEYLGAMMPILPAVAALDDAARKRIVLPPETAARASILRGFDGKPEVQALYDRAWKRIVESRKTVTVE